MAPHQTKVRPATEPYEFHRARQKAQKEDMKAYLQGRVIWRSCILVDTRTGIKVGPPRKHELKKLKLMGTYVMPICPLCRKKEKRCKCIDSIT